MAIGTTAALIGASVAGSALQAGAAKKAAKAQERAATNQVQLQERIYNEQKDLFSPFYGAGQNALDAVLFEMGLGPRPTFGATAPEITEITDAPAAPAQPAFAYGDRSDRENARLAGTPLRLAGTPLRPAAAQPVTRYSVGGQVFNTREAAEQYANANRTGGTEYRGFQATPGYEFQFDQGIDAIDRSAASSGGLFSGATMKAAEAYGQGLANQEYGNYLSRLMGVAASGQNAAGQQGAAAESYASGASNAYANMGNAGAAGAIGVGNAINAGLGNTIGVLQYQNALNPVVPSSWGIAASIRPRPSPFV